MALAIFLMAGCSTVRLVVTEKDGLAYEEIIEKFLGMTIIHSKKPVKTRKQKIEDRRDEIAEDGVVAVVVGVFMALAGIAFHALYKNPLVQRVSAAVAVLGGVAVVGGFLLIKLSDWYYFAGVAMVALVAWIVLHFLRDKGFGNEKDSDSRTSA